MTKAALRFAGVFLVIGALSQLSSAQVRGLPRSEGGKPDFSGVWQAVNAAAWNLEAHSAEDGTPAGESVVKDGPIPYLRDYVTKRNENGRNAVALDPVSKCFLPGVPRATYMPWPFQIVQTEKHIGFAYEFAHATRMVYLDGTTHPEGDIDFWMGDSRGRWEGNTLVVDVANLNDQTWFDKAGNFHSGQMRVVERYSFIDADHIQYEATITDPKVFARPWTIAMPLYRRIEPNAQLLDYECTRFIEHSRGEKE
jgi:hypothetical protein